MKPWILVTTLTLISQPALATTERDALAIACTIGKADAGEPELTTEAWLQACTQWMEIEPEARARALTSRASIYKAHGQFDMALADLSETISLGRRTAYVYQERSRLYARLNQVELALEDASQAIALFEAGRGAHLISRDAYLIRAFLSLPPNLTEANVADHQVALKNTRKDLTSFLAVASKSETKERALAQATLSQVNALLRQVKP